MTDFPKLHCPACGGTARLIPNGNGGWRCDCPDNPLGGCDNPAVGEGATPSKAANDFAYESMTWMGRNVAEGKAPSQHVETSNSATHWVHVMFLVLIFGGLLILILRALP